MNLKNFLKINTILLLFSLNVNAKDSNNYDEAKQKLIEASYVYFGIDIIVNKNVQKIQEKVPKRYKKTLDIIVPIVDIVVKKRVELKYEF